MKLFEILDTGGKIIGFVDSKRLDSRRPQEHKARIEVPVLEPVSDVFDPNVAYEEMTYCRAVLEWHEVRFFKHSSHVSSHWYLIAINLPDDVWKDDAFIQHVWK